MSPLHLTIAAALGFFVGFVIAVSLKISKGNVWRERIVLAATVLQSVSVFIAVVALGIQYGTTEKQFDAHTAEFVKSLESTEISDVVAWVRKLAISQVGADQHGEEGSVSFRILVDYPEVVRKYGGALGSYIDSIELCLRKRICDRETTALYVCKRMVLLNYVDQLYAKEGEPIQHGMTVKDCFAGECLSENLRVLSGMCKKYGYEEEVLSLWAGVR